jgi:alpha-D-xyloside xylohydrolase
MKRNLACVCLGLLAVTLTAQPKFQKTTDGVIIYPQLKDAAVKMVQLSVINNKIIQVKSTPENQFSTEKSLIAVKPFDNTSKWKVKATTDSVYLTTAELKAAVSLKTGEISFADKKAKHILNESKGDGKSFTPITVEGTKGYTLTQKFDSPDDEAFYGLGQHQSDEFNYKGKNETLFQYNTKVSVPFVISNKNYGILWDNYSLSKFGDKRDYAQMNQFKLFDKNGVEKGLTATYMTNSDPNKVYCVRPESIIDYENLETQKNFPEGFLFANSTITWEGSLEASESGIFRFILYYAGYTKVLINNELVVTERWRTAWNPNSYKFNVDLKAGVRVPVKIEWKPDGGAYLGLKALSPVSPLEQNKMAWWSEMGNEINYYFIAGNSMDEVISGYRNITGKAQIMPAWAMGFWQSRERYKTQDEIVGTLKEFRQRQIPIDNIVMDWFYWKEDQWGSQEFDPKRFPNPTKMISDIHDMNGKIMISVWPKFYANTDHYKEFDKKGWMYQRATNDSVRDWVGKGYVGSFYDAYSAGARKLFWNQLNEHLFPKGIDAWWMDASEPDILSNASLEYRKILSGPTALGPSTKYFNTYALMNAEAIYDGQRSVAPNKRVFLLTRSGFAGLQRYSTATWSGDIGTRWEDLKSQISAGLNFALSGIPYWTMDIGGFCVESRYEKAQKIYDATKVENDDLKEWRELNARWYQFGAFAPLFRAHGQFPLREIYNIAPENHAAYKSILYYNKLRYSLMPYIYTLAGMTNYKDYTIMRALVMDCGADKKVENISDQYMFGTSLMVCPVYKYQAREREVYFPATNGWYDFYTGKFVSGNQKKMVNAPYERMPIFVPEGAIIPFGPEIQYTNEKKPENITIYVYAGKNGSFELYEDEGVNYNYEKGASAKIRFDYNDKSKTLTINNRVGSFSGMLEKRTFNIVYVTKQNATSFDLKNQKGKAVLYNGKKISIKL